MLSLPMRALALAWAFIAPLQHVTHVIVSERKECRHAKGKLIKQSRSLHFSDCKKSKINHRWIFLLFIWRHFQTRTRPLRQRRVKSASINPTASTLPPSSRWQHGSRVWVMFTSSTNTSTVHETWTLLSR